METRIIKAVFGASKSIIAPKRFKNDWGQVLELVGIDLPQTFTAHFANSKTGMAKKRIGQNNQVDVPDEFFTSGADIYCWVMVHDTVSDGRTMYTVRIPIEDRADATDVEPTPVEQDVIEQAISALNSAVEKTAQDVESADASAQSAKADADRAETARDTAEEYVSTVQNYAQQAQASANNASASATASANSASQAQRIKTDVESMVDEAQSAAGASAQSALESAQSASQASVSAASASQSAETASTKASEASASAQTASAKATEASGYASTASQKASESSQSASTASGYATQAGQAKTAAETAQGLAEQAQSDAESAKDDAESARDEAQQIASGISGKVEQIDQNTADIVSLEADRYKAYATDTATGAVASFPDGADNIPMADVKVSIEPVQDLSHGDPSPDNICPISGWTGANVSRIGKNLLIDNFSAYEENYNYRYLNNVVPFGRTAKFTFTDKDTSIDLSGCYIGFQTGLAPTTSNATAYRWAINNGTVQSNLSNVAVNDVVCDGVMIYPKTQEVLEKVFSRYNVMVELGSTATAYEPYTGQTYPITFPTEAGTVYGGTLDVTTGELTVDRAMVDLGTLNWISEASYSSGQFRVGQAEIMPLNPNYSPVQCSILKGVRPKGYTQFNNGEIGLSNSPTDPMLRVRAEVFIGKTAEEIKAIMQGQQLVYEPATPITYQLTPTEIRSLLGQNNIFADTGNSTAEYRADTKLYIQKKITEAVNALA